MHTASRLILSITFIIWVIACDDSKGDDTNNNTSNIEVCDNGIDDDLDGQIDCEDAECHADPACRPATETVCNDNLDNDGDGYVDCDDADCNGSAECPASEFCNDGLDNDGDGQVDCDDTDCVDSPYCMVPEICDDGQDNDGDGQVDCEDTDCEGFVSCSTTGEINCNDNIDADGDHAFDCADSDCAAVSHCQEVETLCSDNIDNDGDGAIDCADSDCVALGGCSAGCNPHGDYIESNDFSNDTWYGINNPPENTGLAFDPAGYSRVTIGGCINPKTSPGYYVDADTYLVSVVGDGIVRVVLTPDSTPLGPLWVGIGDSNPNSGFYGSGRTISLAPAVAGRASFSAGDYIRISVWQELPAASSPTTYSLQLVQNRYPCAPLTGSADYIEAGDDASNRGNDMVLLNRGQTYATETDSPDDRPEETGITTTSGGCYLISGVSAAVDSPDGYLMDRDTYEFTTGPDTSEVAIRIDWPAGIYNDMSLNMMKAYDYNDMLSMSFVWEVDRPEMLQTTVEPNTTYWIVAGSFYNGGAFVGPSDYDITLCAF
ncbi:hypothetical protein KKF84_04370 [Myxococcota bacterium]|nr:hypothetical protein [Myxococcota bacterium]MBU1534530.1 hypothetical protein [Myxococcota bacterium]